MKEINQEIKTKLVNLPKSVEGHWDLSHADIIKSLGDLNIKTMLEIGFNNGFSCTLFLHMLELEKFYSIDIGIHPFIADLQQKFKVEYGDRFYPYISDSLKIRETELNDMTFDLIFVDGGHKFDVASNDFMFALDKCKYILLDDTNGASPGVTQLVKLINNGDGATPKLIGSKVELVENFTMGAGAKLYKCL